MTKFVGIRAKTYSYLIDDSSENKKAKGTKTSVIKKTLNLKIIKTVQEQLIFIIKKTVQQKMKLPQIVLKEIINNS